MATTKKKTTGTAKKVVKKKTTKKVVKKKTAKKAVKKTTAKKAVARKPSRKTMVSKKAAAKGAAKKRSAVAPTKNFSDLPLSQVAAIICGHLHDRGFDPVLTGRSCAAIYINGGASPATLDFVVRDFTVEEMRDALKDIGFKNSGHRTYVNRTVDCELILTPHPVVVGDDVVRDLHIMRTHKGDLRMLTPTDCVRQRLSMFYRWNEEHALDDAVRVARRHEIDLELVRRWSDWEWASDQFDAFRRKLSETEA